MSILTQLSEFNILAYLAANGSNIFLVCITEPVVWWPIFSGIKIPELLWYDVEEGIQKIKEV